MTKYFVDPAGNYLGGFDGAAPPAGAAEVPEPPKDARQKWDGTAWGAILLYRGAPVFSAADVDRATAARIQALLVPEWVGDLQMAVMRLLRLMEDALADLDTVAAKPGATQAEKDAAQVRLAAARDLRAQIMAERQAGADFKAGHFAPS